LAALVRATPAGATLLVDELRSLVDPARPWGQEALSELKAAAGRGVEVLVVLHEGREGDALARALGFAEYVLGALPEFALRECIMQPCRRYGIPIAPAVVAGLMSLLASCELNDINPEVYLADVLLRLATHPPPAPHRASRT
jgi:hypothetical protein